MSDFLTRNLVQLGTYWAPGAEGEYGVGGFNAPVLIKSRWEDKTQKVLKPSGEEVLSQSVVFADRDLQIGGYLAEGDQTSHTSPFDDGVGANEILDYKKVPNLRYSDSERRAYL